MINIKNLILKFSAVTAVSLMLSAGSASAAVSVTWDFSPGNENGWTTVQGVSWLDANGVEAGQGVDIGGNDTGSTRRAHDGAHTNFIYRSPVLNFAGVDAIDPVLEMDWEGGAGNQDGSANPLNPGAVGAGLTSAVGQKGLAFLNLTTGNYDAVYYDPTDGNGVEVISLTQADLTAAGISLTDNYQLDFYENDDGGWGWTRLQEVRLDANAVPEPSAVVLFGLTGLAFILRRRR